MRNVVFCVLLLLISCDGDTMPRAPENILDQERIGSVKIGGVTEPLRPAPPYVITAGVSAIGGGPGPFKKLLQFTGPDRKAQWITFNITVQPLKGANGGFLFGSDGPLVARLGYGVGGASTEIEFNLNPARASASPDGPRRTANIQNSEGNEAQLKGITEVSVFGSSFDLAIRNDRNDYVLFQVPSGGIPGFATIPAAAQGGASIIPFPGITDANPSGGQNIFPRVSAFATYGIKPCNRVYRSFVITQQNPPLPQGTPMVAGDSLRSSVPPMAKRLRVYRTPIDSVVGLTLISGSGLIEVARFVQLGAGEIGPIELPIDVGEVGLRIEAGSVDLQGGVMEYEIEP